MTVSIRVIRKMILVALALIVFSNVADWVAKFIDKGAGIIWGVVTAGVAFYCRSKATGTVAANKKYYLWLAVPALLTVIPLAIRLRQVFSSQTPSWWLRLWYMMPILVNFVIPVSLLWLAYSALERHGAKPKEDPPV